MNTKSLMNINIVPLRAIAYTPRFVYFNSKNIEATFKTPTSNKANDGYFRLLVIVKTLNSGLVFKPKNRNSKIMKERCNILSLKALGIHTLKIKSAFTKQNPIGIACIKPINLIDLLISNIKSRI